MTLGSRKPRRVVNGIVLLDKPSGCSSNHALQRVKRLFNARKAGHTGSLDPLASGMLPLCLGEATKISGLLLDADKTYQVTARLGQRTDTADADGQVVETAAVPELDEAGVSSVMAMFLGPGQQVPPMYSALKVDGQRLYKLARKGEQVERAPRNIVIHDLRLLGLEAERLTFQVRCSKGTYVRSLVEDVAARLGTLAHVEVLRRVEVGSFSGEQMHSLEQLEAMAESDSLDQVLLPVDAALAEWPRVDLDAGGRTRLLQGQKLALEADFPAGKLRIYGPDGDFLGIGEAGPERILVPRRLFPGLQAGAVEPTAK